MEQLTQIFQSDGLKILLVLALSFLVGLEREERKLAKEAYAFGGVRSFPLIGMIGYGTGVLAGAHDLLLLGGFAVVGCLLSISYFHKLVVNNQAGLTTELLGLVVYVVGALVAVGHFWVASTMVIASLLLLELKNGLEALASRIPYSEIVTFTKFLLLTAVVLPLLPNRGLTEFEINPFKVWLAAVAVSAVSYGSYALRSLTGGRGGALLSATLGGAYSSTVTTIVLARQSQREKRPHELSGGILVASGMMYLRLVVLVGLFNGALLRFLIVPFLALGALALAGGVVWSKIHDADAPVALPEVAKNPLELRAACLFALVFVVMMVGTHLALTHLGKLGVLSFAGVMGVADVDPFVLGMTQSATAEPALSLAAQSIVIAASSNNLVKGFYAFSLADKKTGRYSLGLMALLAAAGLVPLWFV